MNIHTMSKIPKFSLLAFYRSQNPFEKYPNYIIIHYRFGVDSFIHIYTFHSWSERHLTVGKCL